MSVFFFLYIRRYVNDNAVQSGYSDLIAASVSQASAVENELEHNYRVLEYARAYVTDENRFDEDGLDSLRRMIRNNSWKRIGIVDLDGNIVDMVGNSIGNAGTRSVFYDLINGRYAYGFDILPEESRDVQEYVFAMPCYQGDMISGVIFAEMYMDTFERIVWSGSAKDAAVNDTVVVNEEGRILSSSPNNEFYVNGDNYFELLIDEFKRNSKTEEKIRDTMAAHESGNFVIFNHGSIENIYIKWTGVNDIYVISETEAGKPIPDFGTGIAAIGYLPGAFLGLLALVLLVLVLTCTFFLQNISRNEKSLIFEKKMNDFLLDESGGGQFVYDVATGTVIGKGPFSRSKSYSKPILLEEDLKRTISSYPEAAGDLNHIAEMIEGVSASGHSEMIDQPMNVYGKLRWLRVTVVPYREDGENVSHVLVSMFDTTNMHTEFDRNAELIQHSPGGLMRFRMTEPEEMEYCSDGFCKMIGYSADEFRNLLQAREYTKLMPAEDLGQLAAFMRKLGEGPNVLRQEYHFIRKDGEVITVSNNAESILAPDGILYCYCTILDISDQAHELEAAKEKLKRNEETEAFLLNEQLLLAAAAKSAYSMIISANLTKNTYYMMEYENYTTKKAAEEGNFDELIEVGTQTIPDPEQAEKFRRLLNRESLLQAYYSGKTTVSLRHKQTGDDGIVHWVDVKVVFVKPREDGDIREITLVSSADENQGMLENLREALSRESIYREAILNNSAGYMEINFTTGMIEGDILNLLRDTDSKIVNIPALGTPLKYEEFMNWWIDHMVVSDKETMRRMTSIEYILTGYYMGNRYQEVPCTTRVFGDKEYDCIQTYFLTSDSTTGDVKGICILIDVTEQETSKREIMQLNEELQDAKIRNFVNQMEPHFLYNSLASIREIILDDPQYAYDLIYDFTTHLRACIKSMSSNELIPFSQELENIKSYVNIEKMRFGDRLKISYDIGCEDFWILPLSIQPLVENSIRHGIYERGAAGGSLSITTGCENGCYTITVLDDGVGFDYEKVKREVEHGERDSTGLSNVAFRLEKIMNADVAIESEIGVGTKITVRIPIETTRR